MIDYEIYVDDFGNYSLAVTDYLECDQECDQECVNLSEDLPY